jgi:alpha(1,3/1,4) fucosyltransferase
MRKIIVAPFSKVFEKNEMFNPDSIYNNENRLKSHVLTKTILERDNYKIDTYDLISAEQISNNDIFLSYNHHPKVFRQVGKKIRYENRILIAQEPLAKLNFSPSTLKYYGKILTWNEQILNSDKVQRIKAYPITKVNVEWIPVEKRKFLTNISINKTSRFRGELYSERLKTILLAENIFPGEFDHYGVGWNTSKSFLQRIGLKSYNYISSYKGMLNGKYETLRHYKFSICYENNKTLPGNITEKIFDCFQCGVIPLYWGAPDILKYIPADTFIWRENFRSNEEMLLYIRSMPHTEISTMVSSIRSFINSDAMADFWDDTYTARIVDAVKSLPS